MVLLTVLDYLRDTVFADKLVVDEREPMFGGATFEIPGLEGKFALYRPRLQYIKETTTIIFVLLFFKLVYAAIVYHYIVRRRGTPTAYLVGYGLVLPSVIFYTPFWLIERLDLRNLTLKFSILFLPMTVAFRCMEAMYGTSQTPAVEASLKNYMTYYSVPFHAEWDEKTQTRIQIRPTSAEKRQMLTSFLVHYIILSLYLSFMVHVNYQPFASPVVLDDYHFNWDLLHPGHVANTYCLRVLLYFSASVAFSAMTLPAQLRGVYKRPTFSNPVLTSRKVSDFWSRKWNSMHQGNIRQGAFLPARKIFGNKTVALILTFAASGLLHELCWALIWYQHKHLLDENGECPDCFNPKYGKVSLFFLWHAMLMMIERPLGEICGFTKSWPTLLMSTIVMCVAAPTSHWFTGDWCMGGYFADQVQATFFIRRVE